MELWMSGNQVLLQEGVLAPTWIWSALREFGQTKTPKGVWPLPRNPRQSSKPWPTTHLLLLFYFLYALRFGYIKSPYGLSCKLVDEILIQSLQSEFLFSFCCVAIAPPWGSAKPLCSFEHRASERESIYLLPFFYSSFLFFQSSRLLPSVIFCGLQPKSQQPNQEEIIPHRARSPTPLAESKNSIDRRICGRKSATGPSYRFQLSNLLLACTVFSDLWFLCVFRIHLESRSEEEVLPCCSTRSRNLWVFEKGVSLSRAHPSRSVIKTRQV